MGTTKALNRVSGVYRDDPKLGIGKLKGSSSNSRVGAVERRGKTRLNFDSTASNSSSTAAEELPSVAALARFAIEREQLAREMGVDELGGPATSGVVNVSALAQGRGRNGKGTGGGKRAKNLRQGWSAGDCSDGEGSEGGAFQSKRYAPMGGDSRFAGEMLLEKLESVAEARSMEVCYCVLDRPYVRSGRVCFIGFITFRTLRKQTRIFFVIGSSMFIVKD